MTERNHLEHVQPARDVRHQDYCDTFYSSRRTNTLFAAQTILQQVFSLVGDVRSVVDVGCGTGVWLSTAATLGARDVLGIEGPWFEPAWAEIDEARLIVTDLEQPITLPRRFDLAISLEVAEHLSPSRAGSFVEDLCAASSVVLFSAAVPYQGGIHHLNEQSQSCWANFFARNGYNVFDCIRPAIWSDTRIPYWYRQNILLFADLRDERNAGLPLRCAEAARHPVLDVVHPELLHRLQDTPVSIRSAARHLALAVARRMNLERVRKRLWN